MMTGTSGLAQNPDYQVWRRLLSSLPVAGIERSLKMSVESFVTQRLLLGVPVDAVAADLGSLLRELGLPEARLAECSAALEGANQVLFGFEAAAERTTHKVYYEYWDRHIAELRAHPEDSSPRVLHLGYKWDPTLPGEALRSRYVWQPLLTLQQIGRRLRQLYGDRGHPTLQVVTEILGQAFRRAPRSTFTYLEVEDEGTPRASFDVNLYDSGLTVGDTGAALAQAGELYAVSADLQAALPKVADRPLGHIAGGSGRRGEDFLTVYYEVDGVP